MKKHILSLALPALMLATAGCAAYAQAPAATTPVLSLTELEKRATAEGIVLVREIEIEDRMVEVKGLDAQQRKVELVLHRVTGEVLSREVKLPKHTR